MVDLRDNLDRGLKRQRATHQDEATWARIAKAAELSGLTMSQVISKLVWEDLHLPDDAPSPDPANEPELPLTPPAPKPVKAPTSIADQAALEGRGLRDNDREFDLG